MDQLLKRIPSVSLARQAVGDLTIARDRFDRSTHNLTEAISEFAPAEGMMTTAQQVAHVAHVIDWFMEGTFRPEGFDMNFEDQITLVLAVESLSAARDWFEKAVADAIEILSAQSDAQLMVPLPPGPVLGGMPRIGIGREITPTTWRTTVARSRCTRESDKSCRRSLWDVTRWFWVVSSWPAYLQVLMDSVAPSADR
jgi:hypothetical protein